MPGFFLKRCPLCAHSPKRSHYDNTLVACQKPRCELENVWVPETAWQALPRPTDLEPPQEVWVWTPYDSGTCVRYDRPEPDPVVAQQEREVVDPEGRRWRLFPVCGVPDLSRRQPHPVHPCTNDQHVVDCQCQVPRKTVQGIPRNSDSSNDPSFWVCGVLLPEPDGGEEK